MSRSAANPLNLLLLDVFKLDSPKQLLEMCKRITSLFAYSSQCDAILKACRHTHCIKLGLVEPVKTRWSSYIECLSSVLVNKLSLQQAIVTPKIAGVIDPVLRDQMLSESTFVSIGDLLNLLQPVKHLIAVAEEDNSNAATMLRSYYAFEDRVVNQPSNGGTSCFKF